MLRSTTSHSVRSSNFSPDLLFSPRGSRFLPQGGGGRVVIVVKTVRKIILRLRTELIQCFLFILLDFDSPERDIIGLSGSYENYY